MDLITLQAQSERAVIVPEAGCQCLSYSVGSVEVIAGPDNPDSWRAHPHRGGIPILFPFPSRVADARFTFKGIEYRLPVNEPARGHAIHGFACERPFRVARQGPYYVTALLDSAEHPDLKSIWPWPFVLEIDYEVGNGLRLRVRIRNSGSSTMPFGFGAHPYFHAPLDKRGSREALTLQIDAAARWPLDTRLIPSGSPVALDGKYDLRVEWTPDQPAATTDSTGAPVTDSTNSGGPTIFTALQQQLGLSLVARKNQALCKVVNRVQLPSEN